MKSCPNINDPLWIQVKNKFGIDNTWKVWLLNEDMLDVDEATFQLYVLADPKAAGALLEKYISDEARSTANAKSTVKQLLQDVNPAIYKEIPKNFIKTSPAFKGNIYDPFTSDQASPTVPEDAYFQLHNQSVANNLFTKLAEMLAKKVGKEFEGLSADSARILLENTPTPYNNQPTFVYNNKLYIVTDRVSLDNVLHEFAEPLVNAIRSRNPELFDNLYSEFELSEEAKSIIDTINNKYPSLANDPDGFKEKAVTLALQKYSSEEIKSQGFKRFVDKLLYQLKQLFRAIIPGKIKVEKMDAQTSLRELADMLVNKEFVLDVSEINNDEINEAKKQDNIFVNEILSNIERSKVESGIQGIINNLSIVAANQRQALKNYDYKELRKALSRESGKGGIIDKLVNSITPIKTVGVSSSKIQAVYSIPLEERVIAGLNSLATVKAVVQYMNKSMDELKEITDYNEMLTKVNHYNDMLLQWDLFIDETLNAFKEIGVGIDTNVYKFVDNIKNELDLAFEKYNDIQRAGGIDAMVEIVEFLAKDIRQGYDKDIAEIRDRISKITNQSVIKTGENEIKKLEEEKKKFIPTRQMITDIFDGKFKDANFWSTLLEAYTSNPDPLIGPFSYYIKKNLSTIENNAELNREAFDNRIRKLLEVNRIKESALGGASLKTIWQPYLFIDKKLEMNNKTGDLEQVESVSLLHPVKDVNIVTAPLEKRIEQLRKEYREMERLAGDETDPNIIANKKLLKDKEAELEAAEDELENHLQNYFNRPYHKNVYEADRLLRKTPEGRKAYEARQKALEPIAKLNLNSYNELKEYENYKEFKYLWDVYNNLYSETDLDGNPKDEEGKRIAQVLQKHRENTKKYYENIEIEGAFSDALESFEKIYRSLNPEATEEDINEKVEDWVVKNTVIQYTDTYLDDLANLYKQLREFYESLPNEMQARLVDKKTGIDSATVFAKIRSIVNQAKDEFGTPDGKLLTSAKRKELKELQEISNRIDESYSKETGLSLEDMEEYVYLNDKKDTGGLNEEEKVRYAEIKDMMNAPNARFTPEQRKQYKSIMAMKSALRKTMPTEEYMDTINEYLLSVNSNRRNRKNISKIMTQDRNGEILIESLIERDPEFKKWFLQNHVEKKYLSKTSGEIRRSYERLAVWSETVASKPEYYKKYTYKRNGVDVTIDRVPNMSYNFRVVKNNYRTIPYGLTAEQRKAYIGTIIDNRGEYLPLNKEQGAPTVNNPYINEAYYQLPKDKKELLKEITQYHLNNQDAIKWSDRLYMELPRFTQTKGELVKSGKYFSEKYLKAGKTLKGALTYLRGEGLQAANEASQLPEDVDEASINQEQDPKRSINFSIMDMAISKSHVRGTARIPLDRVSYDVLRVINEYALSTEKQRVLTKADPILKAIINSVKDPVDGLNDLKKTVRKQAEQRTIRSFVKQRSAKNVRTSGLMALYNREVNGLIYTENHLDSLNKITNSVMGLASYSYFALNIPSALRNYYGALWQLNIEAIGGDFVDAKSLMRGKILSKQAMNDWTLNIYGGAPPTLNIQMIKYFDPLQGKFLESFGKEYGRTLEMDVYSMSWLYSPRKFMEMEAALQLFYSMMAKQKVTQTIDGKSKEIQYADAFMQDAKGKMVLKPGIDKEWDINGKEFFRFKARVHEVHKELNGMFAKFEQPQAAAWFVYKLAMFMRRYFTSMFMKRFAVKRPNFVKGTVQAGYYVQSMLTIANIFRTAGKSIYFMTPKEKRAIYRTLTEFAQIALASMIMYFVFGYDPGDPEKFEKLKEKSGPIGADDFRLMGFLSNHSLSLIMKIQNENESFIPLPKYGLADYTKLSDLGSIAFGPTLISYAKVFTDVAAHAADNEDPDLYYKKDVGPYPWQKEGSAKIWNHALKPFGITGSDAHVVMGLENFDKVANKID